MKKVSLDIKRIKEMAKRDKKAKVSFTLSESVYFRFKKACGPMVMSRVIEELMLEFIDATNG